MSNADKLHRIIRMKNGAYQVQYRDRFTWFSPWVWFDTGSSYRTLEDARKYMDSETMQRFVEYSGGNK